MLLLTTIHLYIHGWSKGYQSTARSVDVINIIISKFGNWQYLIGVKVRLSSLNCDNNEVEIILKLPDFVICVCKVK